VPKDTATERMPTLVTHAVCRSPPGFDMSSCPSFPLKTGDSCSPVCLPGYSPQGVLGATCYFGQLSVTGDCIAQGECPQRSRRQHMLSGHQAALRTCQAYGCQSTGAPRDRSTEYAVWYRQLLQKESASLLHWLQGGCC
jgi:hypothetical protein